MDPRKASAFQRCRLRDLVRTLFCPFHVEVSVKLSDVIATASLISALPTSSSCENPLQPHCSHFHALMPFFEGLSKVFIMGQLFYLTFLFYLFSLVSGAPKIQEQLLITAPPAAQATHCANVNLLRRQDCSYGKCGTECLAQGAFCCGPAGTLATSPYCKF